MKKPNITEGPWTPTEQDETPGHCIAAQVFGTTEDELYVASIRPTEPWSIANANAQAISAVPEMIDALMHIRKCIEEKTSHPDGSVLITIEDEKIIHKALKKAGVQI